MKNFIVKIATTFLGCTFLVVILVIYMTLFATTVITAPGNAIVLAKPSSEEYFAPPCVPEKEWENYRVSTLSEVRSLKFKANQDCVNSGAYIQEGRTGIGRAVEAAGIVNPLPNRWNADGTWNW